MTSDGYYSTVIANGAPCSIALGEFVTRVQNMKGDDEFSHWQTASGDISSHPSMGHMFAAGTLPEGSALL